MKTSALRRWLREERARENAEALAEWIGAMILPGGVRLRDVVDSQGPGDGEPLSSSDDDDMEHMRLMAQAVAIDPASAWQSGGDPDPKT